MRHRAAAGLPSRAARPAPTATAPSSSITPGCASPAPAACELKLLPVGHARFSHEHGSWDEWWALDAGLSTRVWVSVDEGDIALEEPLAVAADDLPAIALEPGTAVELAGERLVVTERGDASCEAVRGEPPEALRPGDRFRYAHLSGPRGRLVAVGRDNERRCTEGRWLDPFEIRPAWAVGRPGRLFSSSPQG